MNAVNQRVNDIQNFYLLVDPQNSSFRIKSNRSVKF